MKEIYYIEKDNFEFRKVNKRECKNNEVEIKTCILGLCGSDIHKFLKQSPNNNYLLTHVLGHEICGIVTKKGKDVKEIKIGDKIVVNPFSNTKKIKACESFSLCDEKIDIVGRTIDGGYTELLYIPEDCAYKLPETISEEDAIFIDDIAVAIHGIHYIKDYKKDVKSIAVIGDGPLGILCYRILKNLYKKSKIILFSRNEEKIKGLGIESEKYHNANSYKETFDVVLEAVGGHQSDTLNTAILLGNHNCLIMCYGVFDFNYMAGLDVRTLFYKQGTIKGINSYCNKYDDFDKAINMLATKKIYVNDLITNRVSFDKSIEYIKKYPNIKNNIKTIFEVNNEDSIH